MSTRVLTERNKLANVCRHHPADSEKIADHRRNLAAAKIEDYVEKVVAAAPPLAPDQIDHIASLLRAGGSR